MVWEMIYARRDTSGIWRVPIAGGTAECLLGEAEGARQSFWRMSGDRLYYLSGRDDVLYVSSYDYATGASTTLTQLPRYYGFSLDVSPNGQSILFDHIGRIESDVILVEEFH